MKKSLVATAATLLALAGCAAPSGDDGADAEPTAAGDASAFLTEHGLDGLSGAEIVDELDRVGLEERSAAFMASVRVDELLLADADQEVSVDLPEDRFYLSVAPYVDQTHECYYHSLTTCTGELGGEELQVRIVDDAGEVLVDEEVTSFDNGFVGFWLPRDVDGTVEVTYDGLTGEVPFATTEDGATCLTTLRLA